MLSGIAIGHFVNFGGHFEKCAPWRHIVQVYLPFNLSVANISASKWSYIKQI